MISIVIMHYYRQTAVASRGRALPIDPCVFAVTCAAGGTRL